MASPLVGVGFTLSALCEGDHTIYPYDGVRWYNILAFSVEDAISRFRADALAKGRKVLSIDSVRRNKDIDIDIL